MPDGADRESVREFSIDKPGGNAVRLVGYVRRLETLESLQRQGKITDELKCAGLLYLSVVQSYYEAASGLQRLSEEAPNAGGSTDPIRLYSKGRRTYRPTQKPRNVSQPRTGFDGWSKDRSNALQAMHRMRKALSSVNGEALRTLYALVIHPSDPHRRPMALTALATQRFGWRNARVERKLVDQLIEALTAIYDEYGEVIEKAA